MSELQERIKPYPNSGQSPLVIATGKVVTGHQYVRWFQRETSNGWVRCDDPFTLGLGTMPPRPSWTFEEAWSLLRNTRIRRAPSGLVGIGFFWHQDERDRVGAEGNCVQVKVRADGYHSDTAFGEGQAEFLWGQADRSAIM